MKRYVYLAGPIAGCSFKEATDWREAVCEEFSPGIVGVSPMRLKEWARKVQKIRDVKQYEKVASQEDFLISGESHAIRARDNFDVRNCDMLFVYLPKAINERRPSWGSSIEIGWGSALNKPIVLVSDDKQLTWHPLVRESVGWVVPSLQLGVDVVNSVLTTYTEGD